MRELFDAFFIPGVCAPICVGLASPEIRTLITLRNDGLRLSVEAAINN